LRTATKKITSLLFILLGFTPLLFVIFFSMEQQAIRHRMKERMEQQALHSITLANHEIQWVKPGKEIWVHGKMFDIKSTEQQNGMTTFHGLYDEEETALKKNFTTGWKKKMAQQKHLLGQLFQSLHAIDFVPAPDLPMLFCKQHYTLSLSAPKLLSQFKTIPTPPPQVYY
jgi:hypothetical protein